MSVLTSGFTYKITAIIVLIIIIALTGANIYALDQAIRGACTDLSTGTARDVRNFNIVVLVLASIALIIVLIAMFVPVSNATKARILASNPSNFAEFQAVVNRP